MNQLTNSTLEDLQVEIDRAIRRYNNDFGRLANGFVYLIKFGAFHKIGFSHDVEKRMRQIFQAVMPYDVKIVYQVPCRDPFTTERILHTQLAEFHHRGEWFALDDRQVSATILMMIGYSQCEMLGDGMIQFYSVYSDWVTNFDSPAMQEYTHIANETDPVRRVENYAMLSERIERNRQLLNLAPKFHTSDR